MSSITVLYALLCEKLSVHDQIVIRNLKREVMDMKQILHQFPYKR